MDLMVDVMQLVWFFCSLGLQERILDILMTMQKSGNNDAFGGVVLRLPCKARDHMTCGGSDSVL